MRNKKAKNPITILNKIRNAILSNLDKTGWEWNRGFSHLLDKIDGVIFGIRQDIKN